MERGRPAEARDTSAMREPGGEEPEPLVRQVYDLALGRAPRREELRDWAHQLEKGLTAGGLIAAVAALPEAQAARAALQQAGRGYLLKPEEVEAVVGGLYAMGLDRAPKPEEIATWKEHLDAGVTVAQMVSTVVSSQEAESVRLRRQAAGGGSGQVLAPGEVEDLVRRLFDMALDRFPSPDESAEWTRHGQGGLSPAGMVAAIADSEEAQSVRARRQGPGLAQRLAAAEIEELVRQLYSLAFDRKPGAIEVEIWRDRILDGSISVPGMAAAVALSPEMEETRARRRQAPPGLGTPTPAEAEDLVSRLYGLGLDREARSSEIVAWRSRLLDGRLGVPELVAAIAALPEREEARRRSSGTAEAGQLIDLLFKLALGRGAGPDEIAAWTGRVADGGMTLSAAAAAIAASPEAEAVRGRGRLLPDMADGPFVQLVYETLLRRGALPEEIALWQNRLAHGELKRDGIVASVFVQHVQADASPADPNKRGRPQAAPAPKTEPAAGDKAAAPVPRIFPSLALSGGEDMLVSAIAVIREGGDAAERLLDNVTSQTIFASRCELIVIDAIPPADGSASVETWAERFPNIVRHRAGRRVGLGEAWNLGIRRARGRYVTTADPRCLRRADSFERQAEFLEKFPFVDVVYQDLLFSSDGGADFTAVAAAGALRRLPIVTPYNLLRFNAPGEAPMWRRALHADVGPFDTAWETAGDQDFWLRCIEAGKVFAKLNDAHVACPAGSEDPSAPPEATGESARITREHARRIVSPRLVSSEADFVAGLARESGRPVALPDLAGRTPDWRYGAVHDALRLCSAASRAPAGTEA